MKPLRSVLPLALLAALACLPLGACSGGGGEGDGGLDALDGDGDNDPGPPPCTTINDCPVRTVCMGGLCQPGTACLGDGDCPGGSVCLLMKEVCVPENPCATDADCTSQALPHCLTASGLCVRCLEAVHCGDPAAVFCNDQYECEAVGPDCSTDADCAGDPDGKLHCDPAQGKCVVCANDTHCNGQHCTPDTRVCVECLSSAHCGVNPFRQCLLPDSVCVECLTDQDCTGGERCNQSSHNCTALVCATDQDCAASPDGMYCLPATGDCVQCKDHTHCGALQWCRTNTCQSGCQTDQECEDKVANTNRCTVATGACYWAECTLDADCAGNQDGRTRCKTTSVPNNPPQYSCVQCTDDAHCSENLVCDDTSGQFVCEPQPCYQYADPDAPCEQIDPCYRCDMHDGQCKPLGTVDMAYDPADHCTYDPGDPDARGGCCQGYYCTTTEACERNLNCQSDLDCAIDAYCNDTTYQCEVASCCVPACTGGQLCVGVRPDCSCQSSCHAAGDSCDPFSPNCCEGLRCSMFWPMCTAG
ncbi:MAG TPA: hypothetical protein PK668_01420 [Myxococcota bacterium]|nr:hypothetical protein [Myxococcota bacterium]HRY96762.1 hypothetical protein [Myxococcota bacterium]HSA22538.1 hypothetical protein [Myxococcota bacterium]